MCLLHCTYSSAAVPEDLFMFNITNLDERLVEVTWRKVHETAVGYRVRLLLVDGTIVGEQSVNKTRAFFEELKAYTTHVLEVEALVSSPLKLPLVSSITFRTGMYVHMYVPDCVQPSNHQHNCKCTRIDRCAV